MKTKKLLVMGALLVMAAVVSLGYAACNGIPNSDDSETGAELVLRLTGLESSGVLNVDGIPTNIRREEPEEQEFGVEFVHSDPPLQSVFMLRITLTNPVEVFRVDNYVAGTPTSLKVNSGSGRVLDVEAYEVHDFAMPGMFTASHYYTITPLNHRTLDLTGTRRSVSIELGPSATTHVSGPVNDYIFGGGPPPMRQQVKSSGLAVMAPPFPPPPPAMPVYDAPLPLPCNVPDYNYNYTNVTDPVWGLTFPSVPTPLWAMGPGSASFMLDHLPEGRNYQVTVFNEKSGIYADQSFTTSMSTPPVELNFTGYTLPAALQASPAAMNGLNPGDVAVVTFSGGGGGWGLTSIWVNQDETTCPEDSTSVSGDSLTYTFTVPDQPACVIVVHGMDGCDDWENEVYTEVIVNINSGGGWD